MGGRGSLAKREQMANSEHRAGEVVLGPDANESLCHQMQCAGGADPTGRRDGGEACGRGSRWTAAARREQSAIAACASASIRRPKPTGSVAGRGAQCTSPPARHYQSLHVARGNVVVAHVLMAHALGRPAQVPPPDLACGAGRASVKRMFSARCAALRCLPAIGSWLRSGPCAAYAARWVRHTQRAATWRNLEPLSWP